MYNIFVFLMYIKPLHLPSLSKPYSSASGMIGKVYLLKIKKIKPIFQNLSLKTARKCLSRSSSGRKVHWLAWFLFIILFFISYWLIIGKKSNIWIRFIINALPIIWNKMKSLSLSLSLSLSRMFTSVCAWAQSRCQGRKTGPKLVDDEDLRLVERYLMKRDLRPTKYWRKSIGVY